MTRSRAAGAALACLCAGLQLMGCARAGDEGDNEHVGALAQAATIEKTVSLSTAAGVPVPGAVLAAQEGVVFGAGAKVLPASGGSSAASSALGSAGISVEPDADLRELWSRGTVTLRDRVLVRGVVHAATVTLGNGVVVDGGIDRQPKLDPPNALSWKVTFPGVTGGNVNLEPDRQRTLVPGRYDQVRVASRSTLKLSSGTYYLSSLQLEPQAVVSLEQSAGPVLLYVDSSLQLRGTFAVSGGGTPDLGLVFLGSSEVFVEVPFSGALVAPNAKLTLRSVSQAHTGFFYGKNLFVDAHAQVKHAPPLAILTAATEGDPEACASLIPERLDLSGKAREVAYQRDIARFCSMPGADTCRTEIVARTNVDFSTAAFSLLAEALTPAQYLAVVHDRTRKEHASEDSATVAARLCSGPDADGDLVPDASDSCPNTPPLTPTFDNGCTDSSLPPAPASTEVAELFEKGGILIDPRCSGAKVPPTLTPGAFYYPGNPSAGTYILAGRVSNQPLGCPLWYFFDIDERAADGTERRYVAVFRETEEVTALVGMAKPVPPGFIQFNPLPNELGARGQLGSAGGKNVRFRTRVMNGGGMRSSWSQWKITTKADCSNLGFECQ